MHLTKKKEKKKRAKIVKMAELIHSLTHQTCSKQNAEKKNMQQPVQPDFVLPSGLLTQNRSSKKEINYPSWTFWKFGVFLEAISKYYSVPFFVN